MNRAQTIEKQLRGASPLTVAKTLKELELYDKKESQEVFDEVYKQFQNGDNQVNTVLKPVMLGVLDSLMEAAKPLKEMRKKGVTASRIWQECETFNYDKKPVVNSNPDAYQEAKNMREEMGFDANVTTLHAVYGGNGKAATGSEARAARLAENQDLLGDSKPNSQMPDYRNNRKAYEDKGKMQKAKDRYFENGDEKPDEYRNVNITKSQSNPDHIIPLARVYDQFSRNVALNSEDIKKMANQDSNFAMIDGRFNSSKGEQLNEEMETFHGESIEEAGADKNKMAQMSKKAQEAINDKANEFVLATLMGKGNVDEKNFSNKERAVMAKEYEKEIRKVEKTSGKELTKEEKGEIYKKVQEKKIEQRKIDKRNEVLSKLQDNAVAQSKDYALGNLIIFIIKPIVYEIKDIIKKGLKAGVAAKDKFEAIKKRFVRVKNYILNNGVSEALGIAKDFVKMLVSSFIEGIINLFVGFYKMIFKIVKEGVKIFVKAYKIIWGEDGKQMTERQKGDAVLKLIGAAVGGLIGIGVEQLLGNLAIIPGWARVVLATFVSGLVSALFMNALDKMDLFSVKSEQRRLALEKIYNQRIKEVEEATNAMDSTAIDVLNQQQQAFNNIANSIKDGISSGNYVSVSENISNMASFLKIELPYGSKEEFVRAYDANLSLSLD